MEQIHTEESSTGSEPGILAHLADAQLCLWNEGCGSVVLQPSQGRQMAEQAGLRVLPFGAELGLFSVHLSQR